MQTTPKKKISKTAAKKPKFNLDVEESDSEDSESISSGSSSVLSHVSTSSDSDDSGGNLIIFYFRCSRLTVY